jgi:hypothetical protein
MFVEIPPHIAVRDRALAKWFRERGAKSAAA